MSTWTHIFGMLTINCNKYRLGTSEYKPQAKVLHELFDNQIKGSERNAQIFITPSASMDIAEFDKNAETWVNYSNRLYVSIAGDLRDTDVYCVKEELQEIFKNIEYEGFYLDEDRSIGVFEDGAHQLSITSVYAELFPPNYKIKEYIKEIK